MAKTDRKYPTVGVKPDQFKKLLRLALTRKWSLTVAVGECIDRYCRKSEGNDGN